MKKSRQAAHAAVLKMLSVIVATAMISLVAGSHAASAAPVAERGGGSPVVASSDQGSMKAPVVYQSEDGWFRGRFVPTSFALVGDQVVATGTVQGLLHKKGERTQHVSEEVSMPVQLSGDSGMAGQARSAGLSVAVAAATCDILNLVLGPLDLNLLGLEIHLDTVVLDIIANPAGGLLGQLLCAVANLLNGGPLGGLLAQLTALLEDILAVLNTGAA